MQQTEASQGLAEYDPRNAIDRNWVVTFTPCSNEGRTFLRTSFKLDCCNTAEANLLRRQLLSCMPAISINAITFIKNESSLADVMIEPKINTVILKSDLAILLDSEGIMGWKPQTDDTQLEKVIDVGDEEADMSGPPRIILELNHTNTTEYLKDVTTKDIKFIKIVGDIPDTIKEKMEQYSNYIPISPEGVYGDASLFYLSQGKSMHMRMIATLGTSENHAMFTTVTRVGMHLHKTL